MTALLEFIPRIAPAEIPTTKGAFKCWADSACVEWPAALMGRAFLALESMRDRDDRAAQTPEQLAFLIAYSAWFSLHEAEKEALMTVEQRTSPQRWNHLRRAVSVLSEAENYL